ncbi:MAG: 3-dehydroquinate synthase [Maricaulaceae bacterium]
MSARTVRVGLGARSYDVVVGAGLFHSEAERLARALKRGRAIVVTDAHVAAHWLEPLEAMLSAYGVMTHPITLAAGEARKNFRDLEGLVDQLLALGVDRSEPVLALGGGVIGDLTGFAAAICKRGCPFIQIPTTLLAQVDSSVGGKTAINTARGKNLVGAFHQPVLVLADVETLKTLPEREFRAGYAEVVKYALLGDAAFFEWLEAHRQAVFAQEPNALVDMVSTCVAAKAAIVAEDEREAGKRALLNLGHTFGHALEAETGYGPDLLHGEAVGVGMAMAFRFAVRLGRAPQADADRAEAHLRAAGLATQLCEIPGAPFDPAALIARMRDDKKAEGGRLKFILPDRIGKARVSPLHDETELVAFLTEETG